MTQETRPSVMLTAVEPSADLLGAALIDALRAEDETLEFFGCGGPAMTAKGLESLFSIDPFSVIGPADALKAWPAARRSARMLAKAAIARRPEAAVFIDSWTFSAMAATAIRKSAPETPLIKYVAPQVWASRPQRADKLAAIFDTVLTQFEFENAFFEDHPVRTAFVGNALFQAAAAAAPDTSAFREKYDLGDRDILVVLPGSRRGEIDRLAPVFGNVVSMAISDRPELATIIVANDKVRTLIEEKVSSWPVAPTIVSQDERFAAFRCATAALSASGTVTTEVAICGTPQVIAYRVGPATYIWMMEVATTRFASIINNAAQKEVIPEKLQKNCTASSIYADLKPLLRDPSVREQQMAAVRPLLPALGVGGPPAAQAAARIILETAGASGQFSVETAPSRA